jgi:hypothetical protein
VGVRGQLQYLLFYFRKYCLILARCSKWCSMPVLCSNYDITSLIFSSTLFQYWCHCCSLRHFLCYWLQVGQLSSHFTKAAVSCLLRCCMPEFLHLLHTKLPGHLLLNYCWMHHTQPSRLVLDIELTFSHLL